MRQESNGNATFSSPVKSLRGLKALVSNGDHQASAAEEIINDDELAQRKAGEAGTSTCPFFPNFFFARLSMNFLPKLLAALIVTIRLDRR